MKTITVTKKILIHDLSIFPNFSSSGSIKGMKEKYYGNDALLIKSGSYIYKVNEEVYYYYSKLLFNIDTPKTHIIEKINNIIQTYGNFTIADVEADSSPSYNSKGRLSHLAEDFKVDSAMIYVYDPNSFNSEEIDTYEGFYSEFELEQLENVLTLAETWEKINVE